MLCLSGFELYSRWVPLTGAIIGIQSQMIERDRRHKKLK